MADPHGKTSFHYHDPVSGIALMNVEASRHVFPNHSHETYYIVGIMEKGASYCCGPEKKESLVETGDLFVINPGQVHSGVPLKGTPVTYRMLSINAARFCGIAAAVENETEGPPEFPIRFHPEPAAARAFYSVLLALENTAAPLAAEEALTELMAALLPYAYRARPVRRGVPGSHPGLRIAEELLSSDLGARLSLDQVADGAEMSPYHLIRAFKQEYGLSPHRYRTQKRIGRAKLLLRRGLPQTEVALSLGFYDQSHFSNAFRSYTGLTPSIYHAGTKA